MKRITQIVTITTAICIAAFDAWIYFTYGTEPTISAVILEWFQVYPLLPFLFGVLCGHLFWPQYLWSNNVQN